MANVENAILELQEHQQAAYERVEELFEDGRFAAVVFPTGCGKSFVTLQYILDHPNERILFVSPAVAIRNQMHEYIARYIGGISKEEVEQIKRSQGIQGIEQRVEQTIPNFRGMLYQTILGLGEKESVDSVIEKLAPDLIVLDEMHHAKTNQGKTIEDDEEIDDDENKWGQKVQSLLDMFPNAKVLGLTATPDRTDGINVVEHLFDGRVALEISLVEAMEEGILIPPRYVAADFVEQGELDTLLEQIQATQDGDAREQLMAKYNELLRSVEHTKGIPEILQENITETDGRYIVFCKDIADKEEKMRLAEEWFGGIDSEPEIYGIDSTESNTYNGEQLATFEASESEHLKLLYVVGKVNEGLHLAGISGGIMSRRLGERRKNNLFATIRKGYDS